MESKPPVYSGAVRKRSARPGAASVLLGGAAMVMLAGALGSPAPSTATNPVSAPVRTVASVTPLLAGGHDGGSGDDGGSGNSSFNQCAAGECGSQPSLGVGSSSSGSGGADQQVHGSSVERSTYDGPDINIGSNNTTVTNNFGGPANFDDSPGLLSGIWNSLFGRPGRSGGSDVHSHFHEGGKRDHGDHGDMDELELPKMPKQSPGGGGGGGKSSKSGSSGGGGEGGSISQLLDSILGAVDKILAKLG